MNLSSSNRRCRLLFIRFARPAIALVFIVLIFNGIYRTIEGLTHLDDETPGGDSPFIIPEAHRRQLHGQEAPGRGVDMALPNAGRHREAGKVGMASDVEINLHPGSENSTPLKQGLPCAWVPENRNEGPRHYPTRVLKYFGYHIRYRDEDFRPCHIIWTFDYPFWDRCWSRALVEYITKHLKRHQRVNHLPGIGFVANKATLARDGCKHCPLAFVLPGQKNDFLLLIKQHPEWQWVVKDQGHRGIKLVKTADVNLTRPGLVQHFIENPMLIDEKKFDFSVYVVILSLNPLRVYMYDADWAARFCKTDYQPFDPTNTFKYVVYGTDHTPLWEMDTLKESWNRGYGFKKSLLMHLRARGFDTEKLVDDVKHVIASTLREKEDSMLETVNMTFHAHNDTRNLFELVRFDFIVDDKLKVYLMEVNMSPDLETDESNPRGQLYTNFLHDLYSMIGIPRVVRNTEVTDRTTSLMEMVPNIRIFAPVCTSKTCMGNCKNEMCMICLQCMKELSDIDLHKAFMEHSYRRGYRRVVPEPFKSQQDAKSWTEAGNAQFNVWSTSNQLTFSWFRGKCIDDITWCS